MEQRKQRVYDMAESGVYSPTVAKDRLVEIETEMMTTKVTKSEQYVDFLEAEFDSEYFKQAILDISKLWLDLSPEYRGRFQKLVFPTVLPTAVIMVLEPPI